MIDDKYKNALYVVKKLKDNGYEAYFVGGCVRDKILNRPIKDYDIVTSALPEEIRRIFPKQIDVGSHFGIAMITEFDYPIEVATYREDGLYKDGRHPESIRFSTKEKDVLRRDFTMNGLLYDPIEDVIIDLVGGVEDINNRTIRTIGRAEERFNEDYLRMLRAIRFSCQLDFKIDYEVFEAIKDNCDKILNISAERIREELIKILIIGNHLALPLMLSSGILECIIPEVFAIKGILQTRDHHPEGDVFIHTTKILTYVAQNNKNDHILCLAALLHDTGKATTMTVEENGKIHFYGHEEHSEKIAENVMSRLKFSTDEIDQVKWLVRKHMTWMHAKEMRKTRLHYYMSHDLFPKALELLKADGLSSNLDISDYVFLMKEKEENKEKLIKKEAIKPLLMGRDLLELGFKPGPMMGKILKDIEEKRLNEIIKNREEAIDYAKGMYNESS